MARGKHAARAAARRDHTADEQIRDLKNQIAALKHEQKIEAARHADELRDLHAEIGQRARASAEEMFSAREVDLTEELRRQVAVEIGDSHAQAVMDYLKLPTISGAARAEALMGLYETLGAPSFYAKHLYGDSAERVMRRLSPRKVRASMGALSEYQKGPGSPTLSHVRVHDDYEAENA